MNVSTAVLVPMTVIAATASVALLARAVIDTNKSRLRYQLWAIHDQIRWDVHAGVLPGKSQAVGDLLASVGTTIRYPQLFTPFRSLSFMMATRHLEGPQKRPEGTSGLTELQAQRVESYRARFQTTRLRWVLTGSPSSWLLLPFLLPVASAVALRRRTRLRTQMKQAGESFRMPPADVVRMAKPRQNREDHRLVGV